ncbi:MAG: hypothetical protein K0Q51_19 [Rickettsiaceae bacterium]|nr:hypothetical protein [Rickettsiaceae bacterium]
MSKIKEEYDNFQEQYESLVGEMDKTDIRSQDRWSKHSKSLEDLSLAIEVKQDD